MSLFRTLLSVTVVLFAAYIYYGPPISVPTSSFLTDIVFAPISSEIELTELKVEGSIPNDLVGGVFLRIGPNPRIVQPNKPYHWFDGDGMIHRVYFNSSNTVSLRSRWMKTNALSKAINENSMNNLLGQLNAPWFGLSQLVRMIFAPSSQKFTSATANTNMLHYKGKTFALLEVNYPFEFEPLSLESLGYYSFNSTLLSGMTAHPKVSPSSDELIAFSYEMDNNNINYMRTDSLNSFIAQEKITLPGPSRFGRMAHDFCISENYVLFVDFPLESNPLNLLRNEPFIQLDLTRTASLGYAPLNSSPLSLTWLPIENGYVFHYANAWEDSVKNEKGEIAITSLNLLGMKRQNGVAPELFATRGAPLVASQECLYQWKVQLPNHNNNNDNNASVVEGYWRSSTGALVCGEFPMVHPSYFTKANRYVWFSRSNEKDELGAFAPLTKVDLLTKQVLDCTFPESVRVGEAFFVPSSQGTKEDDGYLITIGVDKQLATSSLYIVDSSRMTIIATVPFGVRVPLGFHSLFLDKSQL